MKTQLIIIIILTHLAALLVGVGSMYFFWPKEVVEIKIPPTNEQIDYLATKKFEMKMSGIDHSFTGEQYSSFVDSLIRASRKIFKIPVDKLVIKDSLAYVEVDCVPEQAGALFRAQFKHEFLYPPKDSSKVRISLFYAQNNWPLHISGHFEDINIQMPEISKSKKLYKRIAWLEWSKRALYVAAGFGLAKAIK